MEQYFIENAFLLSEKKMAARFNVSTAVVKRVFKAYGIVVSKEQQIKFRSQALKGRTTFTKEEDLFIKNYYLQMPVKAIAKKLDRSFCGVSGRLKAMGLEVPKELREARKEKGMYRQGQEPKNKGKKQHEYMSKEAIARTKATRFKTGHSPHNTLPVGSEVVRHDNRNNTSYLMIKPPGKRKLVYKHIYNWEAATGKKLKKGFNIIFKDGDTHNCEPINLERVSDAELMRRNSIHNYPPEIVELVQLKGAVTRQINKYKNATK